MAKRVIDLLLGTALLLAVLPLMLIAVVAIKFDSPGPILFRQIRYGRRCERFTVLKFRTMHHGASSELHRRYIASLVNGNHDSGLKKLTRDPRVTAVGRVLRKTSIDELPQLVNVLLGQMSLVGPRPAIEYELNHYRPSDFQRFHVRPGITGLWQVQGRNELGFMEMLKLDAEYARRSGPLLDASILLRTPVAVVRGHAA